MDNKTEYFTLKEDGVIGWIENMPPKPTAEYCNGERLHGADILYEQALQSAISNAKEVSNQQTVRIVLVRDCNNGIQLEVGKVYSLQCHVEKKETPDNRDGKLVALVTFYEP